MGEEANHRGNSRRWITREVEDSLRRLGTDRIDLYQIHRYGPHTDVDETLGALTDLRAGKVRSIGRLLPMGHAAPTAAGLSGRVGEAVRG